MIEAWSGLCKEVKEFEAFSLWKRRLSGRLRQGLEIRKVWRMLLVPGCQQKETDLLCCRGDSGHSQEELECREEAAEGNWCEMNRREQHLVVMVVQTVPYLRWFDSGFFSFKMVCKSETKFSRNHMLKSECGSFPRQTHGPTLSCDPGQGSEPLLPSATWLTVGT